MLNSKQLRKKEVTSHLKLTNGINSNTTMIKMLIPSTPITNNFITYFLLPLNMLEEDKISLLTLIDTLTSLLDASIQERFWVIKMEMSLEKLIKSILSHNLFRKVLKLELAETCMPFLRLIHMLMEVEETFLLEIKEKWLKRINVEKLIDLEDNVSLNQR